MKSMGFQKYLLSFFLVLSIIFNGVIFDFQATQNHKGLSTNLSYIAYAKSNSKQKKITLYT